MVSLAVGAIIIALDQGATSIGQGTGAAKRIAQEVCTTAHLVARIAFIYAWAGQDGIGRTALRFLHRVQPIVQIIYGLSFLDLADAPAGAHRR